MTALAWRTGQPSVDPVALCPNYDRMVVQRFRHDGTVFRTDTIPRDSIPGCAP